MKSPLVLVVPVTGFRLPSETVRSTFAPVTGLPLLDTWIVTCVSWPDSSVSDAAVNAVSNCSNEGVFTTGIGIP